MPIDSKYKEEIRVRFSITLMYFISQNKSRNKKFRDKEIYYPDSLRALETYSDLTFKQIYLASIAERDLAFSSVVNLINALKITTSEFFEFFESIDSEKLEKGRVDIKSRRNKDE